MGKCPPADRAGRNIHTSPFDFMEIRKSMKIRSAISTPNQWISLISVKCKGGHGRMAARRPAGSAGRAGRPAGDPLWTHFGPKVHFLGHFRDPFWDHFRTHFGTILGPVLGPVLDPKRDPKRDPEWTQKGTRNGPKSGPLPAGRKLQNPMNSLCF